MISPNLRACLYLLLIFLNSCSKNRDAPLAQLTTTEVTDIKVKTAKSGGTITADGGSSVVTRGVCWSTNPSPTIEDSKTTDGAGGGTFVSSIEGLTSGASYFVRAYATTSNGTAYGLSYAFTTEVIKLPELTTKLATDITANTATTGGEITLDGGALITERGVSYGTSPDPTILNASKTIDGGGIGTFTSALAGLAGNMQYYYRAYATNSMGTSYGLSYTFTTKSPVMDQQLDLLTNTTPWKVVAVTLGGVDKMSDYTNFQLTMTGTTGQPAFNYSTSGRPSLGPWPSSGQFTFVTASTTDLSRNDTPPVIVQYAVTASNLNMSFSFAGNGYTNRTTNVTGDWIFTFNH
jgi:uncharacterized membrane protein (UPF0136 family)